MFNGLEVLSSAYDKAKLFAKNFYLFCLSRTNMNLANTFITPEMVKKVITNLDSSKASGPHSFQWWFQRTPSLSFIHTS